ncbi:DUF4253 domain-containing protein [Streptomyces sp. SP18CS02]|uniref:DUF4253 domain-containing protein n=1 Tax=Streptomyces sp. SP18CS02 TaxID=3002531 RepID=UPI002E78A983|nr:DUF4253 domain-containing protein [Streptomyces sp. SP18CS02]MEE1751890.1 DUF4253 domain-containing protein [Streptomyces sp. SP18CS02]
MVINPNALGLDLPPGIMRVQPSLWYADEAAGPHTWASLLAAREASGMQPVLLVNDARRSLAWDEGNLDVDQVSDPDDHEAEETLRHLWDWVQAEDGDDVDADTIAPFTPEWPGLAPAGARDADPDAAAARVAAELLDTDQLPGARAGLVPARRGADIPAALGWTGACNHTDTGLLSAVLRSWEDRFGIRLLALHFDRMDLSVAAPPRTMPDALAVAAEHHAFCPDNVWQGFDTIRDYAAEAVLGKEHWSFWWD